MTERTSWNIIDESPTGEPSPPSPSPIPKRYAPIIDTLRLYAGWLLAWYLVIIALGGYQHIRRLPFQIPYVEGLFLSPLILLLAFASYIFLLLTSLHTLLGRGIRWGIVLTAVGLGLMYVFSINT
jgi:hypothetical protein